MYNKQQKWEFRYINGKGQEKVCYPQTQEKVNENKAKCKELGMKIISVKKMYPINTYANQHNFELVYNICRNRMCDMECGEIEWNSAEYDRLDALKDKAEKYRLLPLPMAWLVWEDWKEAKEIYESAIIHRQNACIEAGRYDLVAYC